MTAHLEDLVDLGVDAVWLCPFYPSPQADGGYDVADHCDVDPLFGTSADFDALVDRAHLLGIRVLVDVVPNHTSAAHPWFVAALTAGPGSAERRRYVFRDEPTDWRSVFGGSAWTRVESRDGRDQWYLHLFDTSQPDLDWRDPRVLEAFDAILHFWLDRGVDGFRVDVAHALLKDPAFPPYGGTPLGPAAKRDAPYWDQEGVHAIYRRWRRLLDSYGGPTRILCGEVNLATDRAARYVRPGEMHQVFNFPYLTAGWTGPELRTTIDETLAAYGAVGAAPTWVLANHDVARVVTRLGPRLARAAALLTLALPGAAYVYQGDELGLPDHTDLLDTDRKDPTFARTGGADVGRDGARIPLPWRAEAPNLGFGDGRPWLPQPGSYTALARDQQRSDPGSMLALYTAALRLRSSVGLGSGDLRWLSAPGADVLSFDRGTLRVTTNLGDADVDLPPDAEVVLSSDPHAGRRLPPATTAWWKRPHRTERSMGTMGL